MNFKLITMKTLFTLLTAFVFLTLTSSAQNINWTADYRGGECELAMPEWDGYIGNSSYDSGFTHGVNLNDGEAGYDGVIYPHQTKVVRVLMAPGVEQVIIGGTWSHTYSGVTLHGFFAGETNQQGGFTSDFEPGMVCVGSCNEPFIDPTTELYLYSNFLDEQKTITREELGIPIEQPIWLSYVMYQDHDSYSNTNVSLTFTCNVIGEENVAVYREWLSKRPWYDTNSTETADGIYEYFNTTSINNSENNNEFNIYPNPTLSKLQLTLNSKQIGKTVQILDITGKTVKTLVVNQTNQTIDVSSLQNGIYFIRVDNSTQKFIKE